ncbi:MAG: hypothetical protein ACRESZ_09965, partial [Methylococcales bacterium]
FIHKVNAYHGTAGDVPAWVRHPVGREIWRYTSWVRVMHEGFSDAITLAREHPSGQSALYLGRFILGAGITGVVQAELRNLLKQRKTDEDFWRALFIYSMESGRMGMIGQVTSDFYYGMKTHEDLVDISLPVLRPMEGLIRALVTQITTNNSEAAARDALKSSPLLEDAARLMGFDFKRRRGLRGGLGAGLGGGLGAGLGGGL